METAGPTPNLCRKSGRVKRTIASTAAARVWAPEYCVSITHHGCRGLLTQSQSTPPRAVATATLQSPGPTGQANGPGFQCRETPDLVDHTRHILEHQAAHGTVTAFRHAANLIDSTGWCRLCWRCDGLAKSDEPVICDRIAKVIGFTCGQQKPQNLPSGNQPGLALHQGGAAGRFQPIPRSRSVTFPRAIWRADSKATLQGNRPASCATWPCCCWPPSRSVPSK